MNVPLVLLLLRVSLHYRVCARWTNTGRFKYAICIDSCLSRKLYSFDIEYNATRFVALVCRYAEETL